jgi:hypothetical protein
LDDWPVPDAIEGYCLRCRERIEIQSAEAVYTRNGTPATQGECPICGGAVFRMGRTDLHVGLAPPGFDEDLAAARSGRLAPQTLYLAFAPQDEAIARVLGADLERAGFAVWAHVEDDTPWAGGVHPALRTCERVVLVLTAASAAEPSLGEVWRHAATTRKPLVMAQFDGAGVPAELRRRPRYAFHADYRQALRDLVDALGR